MNKTKTEHGQLTISAVIEVLLARIIAALQPEKSENQKLNLYNR
jgi:hypothetical protein